MNAVDNRPGPYAGALSFPEVCMRVRLTLAFELSSFSTMHDPGDLVLLPELVDGGYAALRSGRGVHTVNDRTLRSVRSFSRSAHTTCVGGSYALRQNKGTLTNSVLVYRHGRLLYRYDKIHLFRPADEPRLFTAGTRIGTFPLTVNRARLRAGVILCYDLRFPELTRFLAREGIEILLVPARWPAIRDEAWRSLLKARAIENQMFVAGCNGRGEEGGQSYVFDPMGALLLDSSQDPDRPSYSVELDLGLLRANRERMTYLDDAVMLKRLSLPPKFRRGRSIR